MKNVYGLTDSLSSVIGSPAKCENCGATTRLGNGVCVSCLLCEGLEAEGEGSSEVFGSVMAEVDVPDKQWRLGNYEMLEEIGRGGMGVIYRARQRHSRRIVALKRILSYHADSRETLVRFRREAEAVASLDHPNILPIYEVGESEEGLPYFSMKFATGGSLRDAARSLCGESRECVRLLLKVARATEYAHGQGILHRDLKPGNILLDGRGEPLVSDFGLAKWLDANSDLTRTLTTFGTPGYIAPEQADGNSDLTAAADVYSLGAILFDLLAGRPPFLGAHALSVIRQASELPAPRLRLLVPGVSRDLETICSHCLERDPAARYRSAGHLAEDLERWLDGRPIEARPVAIPGRVWRWAHRNPMLAGAACVCLLLLGVIGWLLAANATQTIEANQALRLREGLLRYAALEAELRPPGSASQNTAAMRERVYPELAKRLGLDAKLVREKLPQLAESSKRDPDASPYQRASAAYAGADYAEAERLSLQAADGALKVTPVRSHDAIQAFKLAGLSAQKRVDYARATAHLQDAEKLTDQQRNPEEWADLQQAIADALLEGGHFPEAEQIARRVIETRARVLGPESPDTIRSRKQLGLTLHAKGEDAQALAEFQQMVALAEKVFGHENSETLSGRAGLAVALDFEGQVEESIAEHREVLRLRQKVLGPEHPDTIASHYSLANGLSQHLRCAEGEAEFREAIGLYEKLLGPENSETLRTREGLAATLGFCKGMYPESEVEYRELLRLREKSLGPEHPDTLTTRLRLAVSLEYQENYEQAEAELRQVVNLTEKTLGLDHILSTSSRNQLALVLEDEGKYEEAEKHIVHLLNRAEKLSDTAATVGWRACLAINRSFQGKNADAEAQLREVLAIEEKSGATEIEKAGTGVSLANILRDQGKYGEAEVLYRQAIGIQEKRYAQTRVPLATYYYYAYQLGQQGRTTEAKEFALRALEGARKYRGNAHPETKKYAKLFQELEDGHSIDLSEVKFRESLIPKSRVTAR